MKLAGKPAWWRLLTDCLIVVAAIVAAIYVLSIDAGASEDGAPTAIETPVNPPTS